MKRKKDISDLIRDNQHKLNERPNPRAWRKLESKLDNQHTKKQFFLYRQLAMAAAVVAMVAVISLLAIMTNQNSEMFANAEKKSTEGFIAQDLETIYTDANENAHQVMEFQRKLKDRYANPISEGTKTKRLLASNNKFTSPTKSTYLNSPDESETLITMNQPTQKTDNSNIVTPGKARAFSKKDNLEAPDVIPEPAIASNEVESISEVETEFFEEDAANISATYTEPAPSAAAVESMIEDAPIASSMKKEMNSKVKSDKKTSIVSIQQFNWLLGEWNDDKHKEEWKQLNDSAIASGDFEIKQNGNEIYFITIIDRFQLVAQDVDSFVFANSYKDQVVFNKIDEESYSITFIKKGKEEEIRVYKR